MSRTLKSIYSRCFRRAFWPLAAGPLLLASCIDEDLSKCGQDYAVDYELSLSLTLQAEIANQLITPVEQELAGVLRQDLQQILSNKARVMDLSFFHEESGQLAEHLQARPNNSQLAMTFYMKAGNYHNVAIAATNEESVVRVDGRDFYKGISLHQLDADTIDAHSAAIYAGYKLLERTAASQKFHILLYMQNSVPVLVVNPSHSPARVIEAYTRRTANGLLCADSTFVFDRPAVMRTRRVQTDQLFAYYTVCFPSADTPQQGRAADDPTEAEGSIWEMDVYTQLPDNKYVKNTLYMKNPLKAGELQVIKVKLTDEGELVSDNPEVGVSVELDWKPGGDYEVEI